MGGFAILPLLASTFHEKWAGGLVQQSAVGLVAHAEPGKIPTAQEVTLVLDRPYLFSNLGVIHVAVETTLATFAGASSPPGITRPFGSRVAITLPFPLFARSGRSRGATMKLVANLVGPVSFQLGIDDLLQPTITPVWAVLGETVVVSDVHTQVGVRRNLVKERRMEDRF